MAEHSITRCRCQRRMQLRASPSRPAQRASGANRTRRWPCARQCDTSALSERERATFSGDDDDYIRKQREQRECSVLHKYGDARRARFGAISYAHTRVNRAAIAAGINVGYYMAILCGDV